MEDTRSLQSLRVQVAGENFQVRTDISEEDLKAVAAYISDKAKIHLIPNARTEPRKQLILMAMEITTELFAARRRIQELEESLGHAVQKAATMVQAISRMEEEIPEVVEEPARRDGFPAL